MCLPDALGPWCGPVGDEEKRLDDLIEAGDGHDRQEDMVILEHDVLRLPLAIRLEVLQLVEEGVGDEDLEEDLPCDSLPVAGGAQVVVFGDELLDEHPLEVDHVPQHQRHDVDKVEAERHPHQY